MLVLLALLLAQDPRPQDLETGFRYNLSHHSHLEVDTVTSAYGGLLDGIHTILDDENSDKQWARCLKYGLSAWLDTVVLEVAHEYGHVSTISRIGHSTNIELYVDDRKFGSGSVNPAAVAWASIIGRPALVFADADWYKLAGELTPQKFRDYATIIYAGGLNQEQLIVARQVDRYLEGELSRLDSFVILWGNSTTARYGSDGDIAAYRQFSGHGSQNAIIDYSMVRFLSGSSMQSVIAMLEGISGKFGGFVKPLKIDLGQDSTIFWPEFQSFLTLSGPSVKTILPIKCHGVLFMPSIEAAHGAEGGLRVVAPLTSFLRLNSEIYHSTDGNWFGSSVELRPWQWLGVYVGYNYANGHTFHHDVYGATMDDTERSVIVGLDAHFRF